MLGSILHVMQVQREQKKPVDKPLYGLIPFFAASAVVGLYLYLNPIILNYHLIPFVFYAGLVNAYSVGLIIIAHLTKDPIFPMQNVLVVPLSLAVVDSLGPFTGLWPSALGSSTYQVTFMFTLLGLSIGIYGSFVVSNFASAFVRLLNVLQHDIITTICDYLDIWCLTIKHPYKEEETKKVK